MEGKKKERGEGRKKQRRKAKTNIYNLEARDLYLIGRKLKRH